MTDKCEVCGQVPPVAVVALMIGPMSMAKCKECLNRSAQPRNMARFLVALHGESFDTSFVVWEDHDYITLQQSIDYTPLTEELKKVQEWKAEKLKAWERGQSK